MSFPSPFFLPTRLTQAASINNRCSPLYIALLSQLRNSNICDVTRYPGISHTENEIASYYNNRRFISLQINIQYWRVMFKNNNIKNCSAKFKLTVQPLSLISRNYNQSQIKDIKFDTCFFNV